jgi:tetratricopeptide (TPR) repeat protein
MPSHIYMRVGRYTDAVDANERAVAVDERYIAQAKPAGMYPMMYYPHNVDFLWNAASMEGRSADTLNAARKIAAMVPPEAVRHMPDIENAHVAPLFALSRFGRWEEILKEPAPADDLPFATGTWHYARGLAFARTGRLADADAELAALRKIVAATPDDRPLQQVNKQKTVLGLAEAVLAGELAAARGHTDDAVRDLRNAVRIQDGLRYMEPPPWYYPVRQSLGAVLLGAGRAKEAEAVYREDLRRNPENGWSLYGLAQALRAQKQPARAAAVEARFRRAWSHADVQLTASRL